MPKTVPLPIFLLSIFCMFCAFHSSVAAEPIRAATMSEIQSRKSVWRSYAPVCPSGSGFASKPHCDNGDFTLFNGLMCAAGMPEGCEGVRAAQGPDGRWWRAPTRIGDKNNDTVSFSRDMMMGVLLYLTETRDKDAAMKWLRWIKGNRACALENRSRTSPMSAGAWNGRRSTGSAGTTRFRTRAAPWWGSPGPCSPRSGTGWACRRTK